MDDPLFRKAYARGVRAAGQDYNWHWRVHVGLWAAACASRLDGDFVECGVNRGFLSSAIMVYLDWDSLGKQFYLLDTFRGLDERFVSAEDEKAGAFEKNRIALWCSNPASPLRSPYGVRRRYPGKPSLNGSVSKARVVLM